jgi:hypothetical protein
MIIGILTVLALLFAGGGSLEFFLTNLKEPVKAHVQDKDRRGAVLDASKALGKELKSLHKDVNNQFGDYTDLHTDYTSTPAEFDAVTDKMIASQSQLSKHVLDARDEIKKNLTAEEWTAIFKAD